MHAQITAGNGTATLPRDKCWFCCEHVATYEHDGNGYCELCAGALSARDRGGAAASLEILAATVRMLRVAGLTDKEIVRATREAIRLDKESRQWSCDEFVVTDWQGAWWAQDDERFKPIEGPVS